MNVMSMTRTRFFPLLLAALVPFAPAGLEAAILNVPSTSYPRIQDAVTAALPGDTVLVAPGAYQEAVTLTTNGVKVRGQETARTLLSGSGNSPIFTISSAVSGTIRNFTFLNASVGIIVSGNSSTYGIVNNVFQAGSAGTAIEVQGSPGVRIANNALFENGTAVSRDADIVVLNNIFKNNTTAIVDTSGLGLDANTDFNAFDGNVTDGPTGPNPPVTGDPLFVDPVLHDFHLRDLSPCIDAGDPSLFDVVDGTPSDIGAYGGPNADPTPFQVQGLSVVSTTNTSIDVSWLPNQSYLVMNYGGYVLYYGYASGDYTGTDAFSGTGPSPIDIGNTGLATTYSLPDLTPPLSLTPAAPVLLQLVSGNTALNVEWSGVSGATGYYVHYGEISPGQHRIDAGNTTSYLLTGLTNGQPYYVAVSAYARPTYYLAITSYDSMSGVNESALSVEVPATLASVMESGRSDILTGYPDALAPYPTLPQKGGGCFIATAAYGSDTATEVQALRSFRDRYLLTSETGRRFVTWYYRNSPAAAELLNAHPAFKPAVRAMLLPAVAAAGFLTGNAASFPAGAFLALGTVIAFIVGRKGPFKRRGIR